MFATILSWIQSNPLAASLPIFTAISYAARGVAGLLSTIGDIIGAFGKDKPQWIATGLDWTNKALSFIGQVVHFFNGNVQLK